MCDLLIAANVGDSTATGDKRRACCADVSGLIEALQHPHPLSTPSHDRTYISTIWPQQATMTSRMIDFRCTTYIIVTVSECAASWRLTRRYNGHTRMAYHNIIRSGGAKRTKLVCIRMLSFASSVIHSRRQLCRRGGVECGKQIACHLNQLFQAPRLESARRRRIVFSM